MTTPTDRPDTGLPEAVQRVDLDFVEREFLRLCGSCDGGLPVTCSCSNRDFRVPLAALVNEARAARADYPDVGAIVRNAKADALEQAAERWARSVKGNTNPIDLEVADRLAQWLPARAAAIREGRTDGN